MDDLISRLRALSRHEHSDMTIGDEAADALAASTPPAEAQPVACDEDRFEQFLQAAIARSPEPLRELGEYLAGVLDDDQWPAADRLLLQLATATPSAPVGVGVAAHIRELEGMRHCVAHNAEMDAAMGAAIAALAQQPAAVDEEGTVVMRKSTLQYCIRELDSARQGYASQALSKVVHRVLTNALACSAGREQ